MPHDSSGMDCPVHSPGRHRGGLGVPLTELTGMPTPHAAGPRRALLGLHGIEFIAHGESSGKFRVTGDDAARTVVEQAPLTSQTATVLVTLPPSSVRTWDAATPALSSRIVDVHGRVGHVPWMDRLTCRPAALDRHLGRELP